MHSKSTRTLFGLAMCVIGLGMAGTVTAHPLAQPAGAMPVAAAGGSSTDKDDSKSKAGALPSFEQLDTNKDGRLQRSEIPHSMHELRMHFFDYDSSGDRALSPDEYQAYVASHSEGSYKSDLPSH